MLPIFFTVVNISFPQIIFINLFYFNFISHKTKHQKHRIYIENVLIFKNCSFPFDVPLSTVCWNSVARWSPPYHRTICTEKLLDFIYISIHSEKDDFDIKTTTRGTHFSFNIKKRILIAKKKRYRYIYVTEYKMLNVVLLAMLFW